EVREGGEAGRRVNRAWVGHGRRERDRRPHRGGVRPAGVRGGGGVGDADDRRIGAALSRDVGDGEGGGVGAVVRVDVAGGQRAAGLGAVAEVPQVTEARTTGGGAGEAHRRPLLPLQV